MLKVSIKLPGDALITFEASGSREFQEAVGPALSEVTRHLLRIQTAVAEHGRSEAEGNNVVPEYPTSERRGHHADGPTFDEATPSPQGAVDEESYARFCASISPLGDMRRVIVATEGAGLYLGMDKVSEREVGPLFDLAGWRRPGNFIQTLRNAARNKFRWLERVPGTTGYYSVTDTGRKTVLETT